MIEACYNLCPYGIQVYTSRRNTKVTVSPSVICLLMVIQVPKLYRPGYIYMYIEIS